MTEHLIEIDGPLAEAPDLTQADCDRLRRMWATFDKVQQRDRDWLRQFRQSVERLNDVHS